MSLSEDPAKARGSGDTGDTELHRAAEIGDLEMMEKLIAASATADAVRADGYRPVHCALHRGRKLREQALDSARFLLKRGRGFADRWNPREVALLLIERGADANRAGADWARPLAWARRKGHAEMVELLRANGRLDGSR